ncbi:MAG TPA: FAD-binding oxidoreductase [Gammaproteobacteria bacterium]|nr:FAD-binding oxidoreductase [Gammaproteobacteria bacterium]
MSSVVSELRRILGERALVPGADARQRVGWTGEAVSAAALVRPATTEEVAATLAVCNAAGQAVVPHGGLTGLVGGASTGPDELALSLERMAAIEDIDTTGRTMTVQAGVPLQTVQEQASEAGLMFPLDLGARGSCTIGGNAATNAGGVRVIRYGMMRQNVLGLEVVLADGRILSSLNRMLKNNAGYDLKQLFIGSEGTLGVITRLVLRLVEMPRSRDTALVGIREFDRVARFLRYADASLGGRLSAFEVMWRDHYVLATRESGRHASPLPGDYAYRVLLESLGSEPESDREDFESALASALEQGLIEDAVIAKSAAERDAMWAIREDVEVLLRFDPIFLFDVSLPIRDMPAYLDGVRAALDAACPQNRCFVFGHLGDGNLHLSIAPGERDAGLQERVERIVYGQLEGLGGSISAEHGIGLAKKPHLPLARSEVEIGLMRALKTVLDPNGILNPGKMFDPA